MNANRRLVLIVRQVLPPTIYNVLAKVWEVYQSWPPVGWVRFGSLRRVTPISRSFGYNRGLPVDRYYIERFLALHAADIRGRVLEVGDNSYTYRFGSDHVAKSDVLHVVEGNPQATIIGDLASAEHIPSNSFDCIILTQTLHLIYDVRAAIATIHRILAPNGVALITFPGISQISLDEWSKRWYWSFTTLSARRLFTDMFPINDVKVEAHGNVLAATAFLYGLATQEMRRKELDIHDPQYELLITVRAVKSTD
jgi:SAM-dependent methyltransferase